MNFDLKIHSGKLFGVLFQQNEKKQYILPADTPNSTKIHECAFRKNMKHLSIRNSEHSGSARLKGLALLNFVITPLYGVMPVKGADAVGYECS